MQTIQFNCPQCGTAMAVGMELLGKQVRCPTCKAVVTAPQTPEPPNQPTATQAASSFSPSPPPPPPPPKLYQQPPEQEGPESIFGDSRVDDEVFDSPKPQPIIPPTPSAPSTPTPKAASTSPTPSRYQAPPTQVEIPALTSSPPQLQSPPQPQPQSPLQPQPVAPPPNFASPQFGSPGMPTISPVLFGPGPEANRANPPVPPAAPNPWPTNQSTAASPQQPSQQPTAYSDWLNNNPINQPAPPTQLAQPNPAWPNQPVQPMQFVQPAQPAQSAQPAQPNPAWPNQFVQPAQPAQPNSAWPNQPMQPAQPAQPNPAWPNQPIQPMQPAQPNQAWPAASAPPNAPGSFNSNPFDPPLTTSTAFGSSQPMGINPINTMGQTNPSPSAVQEQPLMRQTPKPSKGIGTMLLLALLIPYSILATGTAGILFLNYTKKQPHPLENIPESDDPGVNPKGASRRVSYAPTPLPDHLRTRLGVSISVGDLTVTPERVEQRRIALYGYNTGIDPGQVLLESGEALVLTLKVKNNSKNVAFAPNDPAFNRAFDRSVKANSLPVETAKRKDKKQTAYRPNVQAGTTSDVRPNTFLQIGEDKFSGPFNLNYLTAPTKQRLWLEGFENDYTPLQPGQERLTAVATAFDDKRLLELSKSTQERMLWRVMLRRGIVEYAGRDIRVCCVIGVEFAANEITRRS